MNTCPSPLQSFAIKITYATPCGYDRKATFSVNATDYAQAYDLVVRHVRKKRKPSRILGGRMIGGPVPSDAMKPGVDAPVKD